MCPSVPADAIACARHPPLGKAPPSGCCQLSAHLGPPQKGPWLYLDVPSPLIGLVGHLLLHAGQLLLQVAHLILVKLGQVIELLLQPLVPGRGRMCDTRPGSRASLLSPGSIPFILNRHSTRPMCSATPMKGTTYTALLRSRCCAKHFTQITS